MPIKPQNKYAPDGGPVSSSHNMLKGWKPEQVKKVRSKAGGHELLITASDYNPVLHVLIESSKKRVSLKQEEPEVPAFEPSIFTREEMSVMTIEALSDLPEYSLLEEPPADKANLVKELLTIRKDFLAKTAVKKG